MRALSIPQHWHFCWKKPIKTNGVTRQTDIPHNLTLAPFLKSFCLFQRKIVKHLFLFLFGGTRLHLTLSGFLLGWHMFKRIHCNARTKMSLESWNVPDDILSFCLYVFLSFLRSFNCLLSDNSLSSGRFINFFFFFFSKNKIDFLW